MLAPEAKNIQSLGKIETERVDFSISESVYLMRFPTEDFHTVTIKNDTDTLMYRGFGTVAIPASTLASFDPKKPVTIEVTSQKSSTSFSHDTYTTPATIFQKTMMLTPGYIEHKNESITLSTD